MNPGVFTIVPDRSVPRSVPWVAGLIALSLACLLLVAVTTSFLQAVAERNERAAVSARMMERGLTRMVESVETVLVGIAEELRTNQASTGQGETGLIAARRRMAEALRFAPHIRQIAIAREGRVLADTNGSEGQRLDMTRIGVAGGTGGKLSQGLLIGAGLEGRFLPLLGEPDQEDRRALLAVGLYVKEGEGSEPVLLLGAINGAYVKNFFDDARVGSGGFAGLVRLDGDTLLPVGSSRSWERLARSLAASGKDETFLEESSFGWPEISIAARISSRYSMAVVLQFSHADTLAAWAERNRVILMVLGLATIGVVGASALLLMGAVRRNRLQRQVGLLARAVEQSPVVVLITDAKGDIEYVNPVFTRLFGYAPEEVQGSNPRVLSGGRTPRATYAALWETLLTGRAWTGEFINRSKSGETLCVAASISAVRAQDGTITHFVGVMDDVTEAREAARERERLIGRLGRANADLQRFAEISAHHLQEPSRRLALFAQRLTRLLAGRSDIEPDIVVPLGFIEQQARRLRSLLRDIQLYLSADQLVEESECIDAEKVLREILARLKIPLERAGATVDIGPLPSAQIGVRRLGEVFAIFLSNAIKFRDASRSLQIVVTGDVQDGRIYYRISDNGSGIPPEYRERVFRVFERLSPTGDEDSTGIGLAIARRMIENSGGRVWIDPPADGVGTIVVVELPWGREA